MPPLINLLRGNAVKLEFLRQVCDLLEISTTPKTKKCEMQTAIDELVLTYPAFETQVRETINKLVAESKKQKTESVSKQNETEAEKAPATPLSPSAPAFHPSTSSKPPGEEPPPDENSQPPLFDGTQNDEVFTPVLTLDSTEHMDTSTSQNSNDHKRKLPREESDDEVEVVSKRNRFDYSTEPNELWKDIRLLVSAFKETEKAYQDERKARIHAEKERDTAINDMHEFKETMKREIHESIQQGISHGMEKLSVDLAEGLSKINKSSNENDRAVPNEKKNEINNHSRKTSNTHHRGNISKAGKNNTTVHTPKINTRRDASHTQNTQKTKNDPEILFVSDSNGYDIDAQQLKPESKVKKEIRYNLGSAKNVVPKLTKPELVKDVVFQVGLNDFRELKKMPQTENIQETMQTKTLEMQKRYRQAFPNARQHVIALPPMDENHIEVNATLQRLCKFTGSNFVSTKPFLDRHTNKLRGKTMCWKEGRLDFHYNSVGTKILAKEIKKSLYSTANIQNKRLTQILNCPEPICIE